MRFRIPGHNALVEVEFDDWIVRAAKAIWLLVWAAAMVGVGWLIKSYEWKGASADPTLIGALLFFAFGGLLALVAIAVWRGKPFDFRL